MDQFLGKCFLSPMLPDVLNTVYNFRHQIVALHGSFSSLEISGFQMGSMTTDQDGQIQIPGFSQMGQAVNIIDLLIISIQLRELDNLSHRQDSACVNSHR